MEHALDVAVDGRAPRNVHTVVFIVTCNCVWQAHGDDGTPSVAVYESVSTAHCGDLRRMGIPLDFFDKRADVGQGVLVFEPGHAVTAHDVVYLRLGFLHHVRELHRRNCTGVSLRTPCTMGRLRKNTSILDTVCRVV